MKKKEIKRESTSVLLDYSNVSGRGCGTPFEESHMALPKRRFNGGTSSSDISSEFGNCGGDRACSLEDTFCEFVDDDRANYDDESTSENMLLMNGELSATGNVDAVAIYGKDGGKTRDIIKSEKANSNCTNSKGKMFITDIYRNCNTAGHLSFPSKPTFASVVKQSNIHTYQDNTDIDVTHNSTLLEKSLLAVKSISNECFGEDIIETAKRGGKKQGWNIGVVYKCNHADQNLANNPNDTSSNYSSNDNISNDNNSNIITDTNKNNSSILPFPLSLDMVLAVGFICYRIHMDPAYTNKGNDKKNNIRMVLEIGRIGVRSSYRGCGYGRYIIKRIIAVAKQRKNLYTITTSSLRESVGFYRRLGFVGYENVNVANDDETVIPGQLYMEYTCRRIKRR